MAAVGSQCSTFLRLCPACTRLHTTFACCAMQHIDDNLPGLHTIKRYADLALYVLVSTSDDVDVLAHSGCGVTSSLQRHRTIASFMSCVGGTSPADHIRVDNHYCCYNYACAGMSKLASQHSRLSRANHVPLMPSLHHASCVFARCAGDMHVRKAPLRVNECTMHW